MPRPRRRRHQHTATSRSTSSYGESAATVLSSSSILRLRTGDARNVGIAIGLGRIAIGAVFFAAPVTALRIVGADSATATRVTWLSRMTAARDGVLGVGTAQASAAGGGAGWLLAGAVSDAVDAVALAQAVRDRRAGGIGALGMVAAAVGTSALGAWAAWNTRGKR